MKVCYRIWAQTLLPQQNQTIIIFEYIDRPLRVARPAKELANDRALLSGFSSDESLLISLIAEMEENR